MGALDRAFARRAARLAGSTATGSSPSTTHIDLTCRAASRSQIHDPNEPTLTEPDGFLTSAYARQAGNPFARAFARAQATQEASIASDHSRSRYTFSSIPKTGETTFTYGTGTESNRNPYSKRVVNTWNDARFQSVKTTTPMAAELKQLRDLHPRFAEAEQNDLENGITPRDTTMTFSCDTDASFGYAEDKITEADIHRTLGDSIAGYRPLTAGEKAELYADGPIDAEVWYLLSRHVQGTHNLANAEYSSYDRWRKSGYQPVAIRDPHATIFGMKQADAHGRQVVHALDTLLPNATELDLENERTGKSKVDLTITGLNGRHIHTNDTNRLAYKEMARLKMLEHSASDDFDANDVPTFATSLLNETMIPDSSGFCEVLSIDESAESYGDGRAVLYNADTGLVPMRPEHTEKDAESRVIDAQRTLALTAKALLEHKWRTGQFANGSRPRVVLDIKSSCQILAKMDSMLFGQGDEDGQAITMSNQQTSFRPMSATFDEEGIELCGANDVYSLLNLVPQVTPEEVKAAGIVDKTPGVPGADISDLGYESWLEGEALGPEDRTEDMYQADIESCASELSSQWGDLDDERQSVLATSLGFTMQEVELDPETFVMYAARQIVHANKAMEAASRGETPRRGSKRSSVDTGIRPDLSKNSRR